MVRVHSQGRSKGCETCRKRKIKCDEKLPECSQCFKGGRSCPGAASGAVFLIASSNAALSRTKRVVHEREKVKPLIRTRKMPIKNSFVQWMYQSHVEQSQDHLMESEKQPKNDILPCTSYIDEIFSPKAHTQQFLSYSTEVCNAAGISWISTLPVMLPTERSSVVEKALLAAALGYHGKLARNNAVLREGYKWYGYGLDQQRKLVERKKSPSSSQIYLSITLSLYEIVCPSSDSMAAHFSHILGAQSLLDILGPEACKSPELNPLFRLMRALMGYGAITLRKPSIFARPEWRVIPFQGQPRTSFDKIADVLLLVPGLYARLDQVSSSRNAACAEERAQAIVEEIQMLQMELNDLGISLEDGPNGKRRIPPVYETPEADEELLAHPLNTATLCNYSAAHILLLSILSSIADSSTEEIGQAKLHSENILHRMNVQDEVGAVLMGGISPLKIVGIWSPCANQRERAKQLIEKWGAKGGLGGIICHGALRIIIGKAAILGS